MLYRSLIAAALVAWINPTALAQEPVKAESTSASRGTPRQCYEMQRNLESRRQRAERLTEGERNDLKRFEGIYKERCASGGS